MRLKDSFARRKRNAHVRSELLLKLPELTTTQNSTPLQVVQVVNLRNPDQRKPRDLVR